MNSFDAIGWVPTIRGSLSLSLFDISKSIFGDVDKFSIEFGYYNNFVSSRYLVASSLFATDDYKVGKKYCRTFRYVFRGTVNDDERQKDFIANNHLDDKFFENKDLLIGKLSIVVNVSNELPRKEIQLLQSLKALKKKKKEYQEEFSTKAVSCEKLQRFRAELKTLWVEVEKNVKNIETTENSGEPIYKFDVVLSRDGILFLKDDTANYVIGQDKSGNNILLRDTYRKSGTANDFTQNIPIHRLFKIAMNYIKFLFHKNYHHQDSDDNFLPATNLYPIRSVGKTKKILKHQLEAFLNPITALKRGNFNKTSCNSLGIIQYAKSFLYVFENNEFISREDADVLHKFIENQKNDIEISQSANNTIIDSFLTQKNILATITFSIVFLLATIEIFKFVCNVPEVEDWLKGISTSQWWAVVSIVMGVGVGTGWSLKKIIEHSVLSKMFKRKERSNSTFNRNSRINEKTGEGRFSRLYVLRLHLIDIKLKIKNINREEIKGILLILLVLLLIGSVIFNFYFILR